MTLILGMMGGAGAGKSTAASCLNLRGAATYSLAQPLKLMVARAFKLRAEQVWGSQSEKEAVDPRYNLSGRQLLQMIGTDGCRETFGAGIWTQITLDRIEHDGPAVAVVEDVRFPDEARRIIERGGLVWRLECPDRQTSDPGEHESERAWLDAPYSRVISAPRSPRAEVLIAAIDRAIQDTPVLSRALRLGR
jgi:hypothetical protein